MKYLFTVLATLFTALTTTTMMILLSLTMLAGCSPDIEEDEHTEEKVSVVEMAETEPDWADGTMTITVGRFETRWRMFNEMEKSFQIHPWTENDIRSAKRTLTPPDQQYTVDIVILSMEEVGINRFANITEIAERFRELGYRPPTPEEAMEIRLHLEDQPTTATQHKMSSFATLPSEESIQMDIVNRKVGYVIAHIELEKGAWIVERETGARTIKVFGIWWLGKEMQKNKKDTYSPNDYDPFHLNWQASGATPGPGNMYDLITDFGKPMSTRLGPRFAAAVINSEKRR